MGTIIIGGADGPISIFIADGMGNVGRLNPLGIGVIALLLVPNLIYAIRCIRHRNKCAHRGMNVLEQVGRYGCLICMSFNIGKLSKGYINIESFHMYLYGNAVLIVIYWVMWYLYLRKQNYAVAIMLAFIPTLVFVLSGITLHYLLLVYFGIIFGIGHIYVTAQNANNL